MKTNDNKQQNLKGRMPSARKDNNPFRVPEGYFEALPGRVMQNIRQSQAEGEDAKVRTMGTAVQNSSVLRLLTRLSVAAALTGIICVAGLTAYRHLAGGLAADNTQMAAASSTFQVETSSDEMLDYVMLDNSDIEYYLTVAE